MNSLNSKIKYYINQSLTKNHIQLVLRSPAFGILKCTSLINNLVQKSYFPKKSYFKNLPRVLIGK